MSTSEIEGRHLHIHLGAIDPGVTDIHIHVGAPSGEVASEVTEEPTVEPTVAASLARLKAWDARNAENIQAMYDGTVQLGCTPHPATSRNPRPGAYVQPYVRWTHPSHPSGSVGYLNAATFSFTGTNDVPRVQGLPGAIRSGDEVRFPITSPEGVSQALAAVSLIVGGG
jgi:hypothetical protein